MTNWVEFDRKTAELEALERSSVAGQWARRWQNISDEADAALEIERRKRDADRPAIAFDLMESTTGGAHTVAKIGVGLWGLPHLILSDAVVPAACALELAKWIQQMFSPPGKDMNP